MLDVNSPEVRQTIDEMVKHHVGLTSTLAVYELSAPSRVPVDQRVLDALYPDVSKFVSDYYAKGRTADDSLWRRAMKKGMEFERAFVRAGGLLGAGADPCCISAVAGFADQRNFELLVEAGFTAEQAVQIMSANGAKVLGFGDRLGTIAPGKQADLVVLRGDPTRTPSDIRNVETVSRWWVGYDSMKPRCATKGGGGTKSAPLAGLVGVTKSCRLLHLGAELAARFWQTGQSPPMESAMRQIRDAAGVEWMVYEVNPNVGEWRSINALPDGYRSGWLCFESPNEKRRLTPLPSGWENLTLDELGTLLGTAELVRRVVTHRS